MNVKCKAMNKFLKFNLRFFLLAFFVFFVLNSNANSQSNLQKTDEEISENSKEENVLKDSSFFSKCDLSLYFTPTFLYNNDKSLNSAPSPVYFPLKIGINFPDDSFVSFSPVFDFSWNYYLWDGNFARPAEIENRTATVLNFGFFFPATFNFKISRISKMQISAGIDFFLRIPFLATDVLENESGTSGTAKNDVDNITKWFWKDLRFFSVHLEFSMIFALPGTTIYLGPAAGFSIPLSVFFKENGMNESKIYGGLKIVF